MTPPPQRPAPRRRPGGPDEAPTQPLRPVSGEQPYDRRRSSAQQPPYGEHSDDTPTRRVPAPDTRRNPRRGRRKTKADQQTAVITGVIAVLALLVAGVGAWALTQDREPAGSAPATASEGPAPGGGEPAQPGRAADAREGDCIAVTDPDSKRARVETIGCTEKDAVYRVALRSDDGSDTCPDEDYVAYTQDPLLLCLILNARKGECFHESEQDDTRVSCDSADASYKVGEIVQGAEDSSRCGEADAENALTYPDPPLTICRLSVP
jgi:hypothetical protein